MSVGVCIYVWAPAYVCVRVSRRVGCACACVAFLIQRLKHMCNIVLPFVACLVAQHLFCISRTAQNVCLDFFYDFYLKIYDSTTN